MNILIMFIAAILPAAFLFMYIWKKDIQKEPTSSLFKSVLFDSAICIPVNRYIGRLCFIYFFIKMYKFAKMKIMIHVEREKYL